MLNSNIPIPNVVNANAAKYNTIDQSGGTPKTQRLKQDIAQ